MLKNIHVFQVDRSCRSPQFLLHCVWGCTEECFPAWGRSGWCWVQARRGTTEPYTAAARTFASSSARRLGSWCCVAGRTGCRTAARRRDTGETGTWSAASASLHQQSPVTLTFIKPQMPTLTDKTSRTVTSLISLEIVTTITGFPVNFKNKITTLFTDYAGHILTISHAMN